MRTCSIDIGTVNFAIYIEDHESIIKFKGTRLVKKTTPFAYSECTESYKQYLIDNVYSKCQPLYFDVISIKDYIDNCSLRIAMINMLDHISCMLETCDEFLVEKQPPEGKMPDIEVILETYIYMIFKKHVQYTNPILKTRHFTSYISKLPKSKQYRARKLFTTELVLKDIMPNMNDKFGCLDYIKSLKKKDDICDAIVQLQVHKILYI